MQPFDHIAIIYNPISTGNAPELAKKIAGYIERDETMKLKSTLTPTKRARHAEVLAKRISLKYSRPLIISVSGDGGYNEVINGAMNAKLRSKDAHPVVAVVGAGNANDHRRVMRDEPLLKLIRKNKPKKMDLLRIEANGDSAAFERFAHSYIGFGISPQVALRLNRHHLNKFRELQIILKTFFTFKPLVIIQGKKASRFDSLICANINEMAKVLKFRNDPKVQDGKFELIKIAHKGRLHLLHSLLTSATVGLDNPPSYASYSFELPSAADVQLDGEVDKIAGKTSVTIKSYKHAIDALY
jgi:diacylglycerol kinase family enzyme